jgi:hypothetical protein
MAACVCCIAGCAGRPEFPTAYPAEGTVTLDGKPLAGAQVVLHPQSGNTDSGGATAQATTDAAGRFRLTTFQADDGAVAGQYVVTVSKYEAVDRGAGPEPGPNVLNKKFSTPASSPLKVTIEATSRNQLPPLSVTR